MKGVGVFLLYSYISSKICHYDRLITVAHIIDNKYIVYSIIYFLNSIFDYKIINKVIFISIQT